MKNVRKDGMTDLHQFTFVARIMIILVGNPPKFLEFDNDDISDLGSLGHVVQFSAYD